MSKHLEILKKGVQAWNQWRQENPDIIPDLAGVELKDFWLNEGINLSRVDLSGAKLFNVFFNKCDLNNAKLNNATLMKVFIYESNLINVDFNNSFMPQSTLINNNLNGATFIGAKLDGSNFEASNLRLADLNRASLMRTNFKATTLTHANLQEADLERAIFEDAIMKSVNLSWTIMHKTYLKGANLSNANLQGASLIKANVAGSIITGSRVYGVSVWDIEGDILEQKDLIISPEGQTIITVDNIEVAQFIYLIINNQKLRDVIDTVTSKAVLILGRFSDERKKILDSIKNKLREFNYLPILFDFNKPNNQNLIETVATLARMSRFVIVDITDSKDTRREIDVLLKIPALPIQPIILTSSVEVEAHFISDIYYGEYKVKVLELLKYDTEEEVLDNFKEDIIDPLERKFFELKG
ncbi:MAG: pentapeptide repeat-containing protein [Saprospiraceae bacterium]